MSSTSKYDIFISYRREGGYDTAKHLYDLLTRDGYRVSFDIDTLRNGDFDTSLLNRIDECKDFILIVDAHAFDRTLNSQFNPQNDWLRQELAYALKKGKNIIPIFLNGVKGFPNDLPSDIKGVSKKNGPQYNRYYFNDFYKRLKSNFLISKPRKKLIRKISIVVFILVATLGIASYSYLSIPVQPNPIENSINSVGPYKKIELDKNAYDASKLFINVAGRTPIYACAYSEDVPVLVGLVNNNVLDGEKPEAKFVGIPDLSLIKFHNENGVWVQDFSKTLNFDRIINIDDASPFCFFEDDAEVFSASQQPYLYLHMTRSCMGTASADVYHDFIVINLQKGTYHFIEYLENFDSHFSDNGELYKESQYPRGIENLLSDKFSETNLKRVNN